MEGALRVTLRFDNNGSWRTPILRLEMRGVACQEAVRALAELSDELVPGEHPIPVVIIDTMGVTTVEPAPAFMAACKALLKRFRRRGTKYLFGVATQGGIRALASAFGFTSGFKLRLYATTEEAERAATEAAATLATTSSSPL